MWVLLFFSFFLTSVRLYAGAPHMFVVAIIYSFLSTHLLYPRPVSPIWLLLSRNSNSTHSNSRLLLFTISFSYYYSTVHYPSFLSFLHDSPLFLIPPKFLLHKFLLQYNSLNYYRVSPSLVIRQYRIIINSFHQRPAEEEQVFYQHRCCCCHYYYYYSHSHSLIYRPPGYHRVQNHHHLILRRPHPRRLHSLLLLKILRYRIH
mmetsp:Transcript_8193/g.9378  ORF Transcript_8193/g.9378 Transcript_8193/m.9378 type:complete len:203 (-) Transcript_8193:105-713(-)